MTHADDASALTTTLLLPAVCATTLAEQHEEWEELFAAPARIVNLGGNFVATDKPMRERDPYDFYPTPLVVCEAALGLLPQDIIRCRICDHEFIVDPCAGTGVWGVAARKRWPMAWISGNDIRDVPKPPDYNQWIPRWNFLTQAVGGLADLVMMNPPYKDAEAFVRKGIKFCNAGGYVVALLRLAFLEGAARGRGLYQETPPQSVHVLMNRPSFMPEGHEKAGKTDATAYAIFIWQEGWTGQTTLGWLDWKIPKLVSADPAQMMMEAFA